MGSRSSRPIYLLSPSAAEGTIHLPMITFSLIAEQIDFTGSDTLMFSSKQAVKSAEAIDPKWKEYPCIAIGSATKKQIESLGGSVIHHPKDFYADALAEDIITHFSDKKLLYLRPKEISFDSKSYLKKSGIFLQEQIIYETSCVPYKQEQAPESDAIIIFTSPSSIHCFLKHFLWKKSYTAIVIGHATEVHLPQNADIAVAERPLISACIEKAEAVRDTYLSL